MRLGESNRYKVELVIKMFLFLISYVIKFLLFLYLKVVKCYLYNLYVF